MKRVVKSRMKSLFWILGIGICLWTCRRSPKEQWTIETGKVAGNFDVAQIADTVKYIRLETTPEALIGTIYDIQVVDSMIFIFESLPASRILCFMADGRFRYKIDAIGKGPGEYIDLESFTIDRGRRVLELNERTRKKIHVYDMLTGQRVGEKTAGYYFTAFVALSGGNYLLLGEQDMRYRYQLVDSSFRFQEGVDVNNENLDIEYPFVLTCQKNQVYFASLKSSVIYSLDKTSRKISPLAKVNFGSDAVPEKWFESPENKKDIIIEEVLKKNLSLGIYGILSFGEVLVFSYNQGVGDAIVPRWCIAKQGGKGMVSTSLYDSYHQIKLSAFPFFAIANGIGGYIAPQEFEDSGIMQLYPDLTMNENYILYWIEPKSNDK